MSPVIPFRPRSTVPIAVWAIAAAVLALIATTVFMTWQSKKTVTLIVPDRTNSESRPSLPSNVKVIVPEKTIRPKTGEPGRIEVIDGDTVLAQGVTYRLVGFDTPERGDKARCNDERVRAERATQRLSDFIASGDASLVRVACACRPGEEGTRRCNYGRLCGSLTVGGRGVGQILIGEGLAHPYVCGATSCPKRRPWC